MKLISSVKIEAAETVAVIDKVQVPTSSFVRLEAVIELLIPLAAEKISFPDGFVVIA